MACVAITSPESTSNSPGAVGEVDGCGVTMSGVSVTGHCTGTPLDVGFADGVTLGVRDGSSDGLFVGASEGAAAGESLGADVGCFVGGDVGCVGDPVGSGDGAALGVNEREVGDVDGTAVGAPVGICVGGNDGDLDGATELEGLDDGVAVGRELGDGVG